MWVGVGGRACVRRWQVVRQVTCTKAIDMWALGVVMYISKLSLPCAVLMLWCRWISPARVAAHLCSLSCNSSTLLGIPTAHALIVFLPHGLPCPAPLLFISVLCGCNPFDPSGMASDAEILSSITKCKIDYTNPVWPHLSQDCQDLLLSLLCPGAANLFGCAAGVQEQLML